MRRNEVTVPQPI